MGVQTDNQAPGMTKWICGCGTLEQGRHGLELCPNVKELEPHMQQSRERSNMLLGNATEKINKWLIGSNVVSTDLFFVLFHYFFKLFHNIYKNEYVWKNMKKYELRTSSKKFMESFYTSIHIHPQTQIRARVQFIVSDRKIQYIFFILLHTTS